MKQNYKASNREVWLARGLIVFVILAILGACVWLAEKKYRADESRLGAVEPRFARLLGIKAATVELDKSIEQAQALIDAHVYSASQEASQVGNAAQQRVREIFSTAGMDVVSSQILPVKPVKPFERIAINVRVEGSLLGFQAAMSALPTVMPTIWVEGFSAQVLGTPTATAPQRLSVSLALYVLRNQ